MQNKSDFASFLISLNAAPTAELAGNLQKHDPQNGPPFLNFFERFKNIFEKKGNAHFLRQILISVHLRPPDIIMKLHGFLRHPDHPESMNSMRIHEFYSDHELFRESRHPEINAHS